MKVQTLKGFRDFLPKEARKRSYVLNTLKKVFESYGFEPLETPALEYAEVLTGKYGDEGDKLMYRFEDNGKRRVALRYDQTVPLARVVAQYGNDLPLPFKRYQIQPVWRAENTQKGRYREFLQVDVDTVGSYSPISDAEIVTIAVQSMLKLGFGEFKLFINDRNIFEDMPKEYVTKIDKINNIKNETEQDKAMKKFLDEIPEKYFYPFRTAISTKEPTPKINEILKLLDGGIKQYVSFNPGIACGLDYYTDMIFEVEAKGYLSGSIAGGGRYDKLIGMFSGKDIPAVGFAFGFDRLIEAMEELDLFPKDLGGTKILVTNVNPKTSEIADELRKKGINTELYVDEKDLDKQLRYADRCGIPYVLIVDGKLTLKNMKSGEQSEVTLDQLPDVIR